MQSSMHLLQRFLLTLSQQSRLSAQSLTSTSTLYPCRLHQCRSLIALFDM